jgi:hypothetical protein
VLVVGLFEASKHRTSLPYSYQHSGIKGVIKIGLRTMAPSIKEFL